MDIKEFLSKVNPDILIVLITAMFAFISWIVKGLIEKPLEETKNTFNKFLEKRIEILTEIKTRLQFVAYFPKEEESKEFKEQIQQILLKDGKAAYLNKDTYESVLRISISPITDEKLLLEAITQINEDLYKQISKVKDEVNFYRKFSNYNPLKRFVGFTTLSIQYFVSLFIIGFILYWIIYGMFEAVWSGKVAILILLIMSLFLIDKWIKK